MLGTHSLVPTHTRAQTQSEWVKQNHEVLFLPALALFFFFLVIIPSFLPFDFRIHSMALTTLSLLPPSTPPCFCGTLHLRSHNSFLSIHSTSSSSFLSFSSISIPNHSPTRRRFHTVFAASSDYYSTLGIPKSATGKEIKAAYRRLARQVCIQFHPKVDSKPLLW